MGHHDAAFGEDQLDVTQAEAEHVIQPNGVADDLGRMPRIRGGLVGHAVSFARLPLKRQRQLTGQFSRLPSWCKQPKELSWLVVRLRNQKPPSSRRCLERGCHATP
jgi:hypothetical protein